MSQNSINIELEWIKFAKTVMKFQTKKSNSTTVFTSHSLTFNETLDIFLILTQLKYNKFITQLPQLVILKDKKNRFNYESFLNVSVNINDVND
jgi:hypothetical protein